MKTITLRHSGFGAENRLNLNLRTPNCSNVVVKNEKRKNQIGINEANQATFSGWIHLQPLHFPAGMFFYCFSALKQ